MFVLSVSVRRAENHGTIAQMHACSQALSSGPPIRLATALALIHPGGVAFFNLIFLRTKSSIGVCQGSGVLCPGARPKTIRHGATHRETAHARHG